MNTGSPCKYAQPGFPYYPVSEQKRTLHAKSMFDAMLEMFDTWPVVHQQPIWIIMKFGKIFAAAALLCMTVQSSAYSSNSQMCEGPLALQILGSGGPIAEGDRAGSSTIIWIDGKAAILVDTGSGAFTRYAAAGARFEDHMGIFITHFHVDHSGDLAAILKSGGFSDRTDPLPIFGPGGNEYFPGLADHLQALLGRGGGAFAYLGGYLDGGDDRARLDPHEVDVGDRSARTVMDKDGIKVTAIPVHHGPVPATAYMVEAKGKAIVFSGDQSFLSEEFVEILKDRAPDILVAHNVIPEGEGQPRGLHRSPTSIGEMAGAIKPRLLILSHNMKRATDRQEEGETAIRRNYGGPMVVAKDLDCFIP